MDNKQKEREAAITNAWDAHFDRDESLLDIFGQLYDAGQSARPEPPEPDGDLVEAANRFGLTVKDGQVDIVATMVRFAATVAARADAPADVCGNCGHPDVHSDEDGCLLIAPGCSCTQFTPAPTSPETKPYIEQLKEAE